VHQLRLPPLSARPFGLLRSGLQCLRRTGDHVAAREPLAVCHLRLSGSRERHSIVPLAEDQHDLQVVLASRTAGKVEYRADLSRGGYQDLIGSTDWDPGTVVGSIDSADEPGDLVALVLAGRRGFESGEGRGGLLAGWHERARAFWEGEGTGRFGTVLSLGTCEQTGIFRGDDMAFLSWFARAPGPAQFVAVADERCVHSSAVLLQHIRRTPADALAITDAMHGWFGERLTGLQPGAFPAFEPGASRGHAGGRWPEMQDLLFALHLVGHAVGTCPILERSDVLTRRGFVRLEPPDAIALSLASELAPHFRHRRTGWMIAKVKANTDAKPAAAAMLTLKSEATCGSTGSSARPDRLAAKVASATILRAGGRRCSSGRNRVGGISALHSFRASWRARRTPSASAPDLRTRAAAPCWDRPTAHGRDRDGFR